MNRNNPKPFQVLTTNRNNFKQSPKNFVQSSQISSNAVSELESRANELLKDDSKFRVDAYDSIIRDNKTNIKNKPKANRKDTSISKKTRRASPQKKSSSINNYNSQNKLTVNTLESDYSEMITNTQNTMTELSRRMFLKHLRTPLK